MGLFSFLSRKKQVGIPDEKPRPGIPLILPSPYNKTTLPYLKSEEYLKHAVGWTYACVNAISNYIAGIPIHLYQRKANGDIEEKVTHELLDLLYRVNDFTTKFDHFWLTTQYLELAGEAPWFLSLVNGKPRDILLLRPDKLSIKHGSGGLIDHYEYKVSGDKPSIQIKPDELVFLKIPDAESPFRGRGTLRAAARVVDFETRIEEYGTEFFENSARPDFVISTTQNLTQEQVEDFKARWKEVFGGEGKRFKMAVLTGGLEPKPISLTQADMQFLDQQRFTRDKILSIFGCPKSVVAISDDVNRANAEAGHYAFAKWTIKPKMQRIIEQLNEFLVKPFFGEDLFLDFEDPVPEDETLDYARYQNALSTGWMTINEVREEQGKEPIEGGDVIYLPLTMVPIGMPEGEEGTKAVKKKKLKYNKEFARTNFVEKKKIIDTEKIEKTINEVAREIVMAGAEKEMTWQDRWWLHQIKIADRFESLFKNKLVTLFNDQKDRIKDKVEGKKAVIKISDIKLDVESEAIIFIDILLPVLKALTKEEANRVLAYLHAGRIINMGDKRVLHYFEKFAPKFAKGVNIITNRKIRRSLSEGVAKDESIPELTKRVEDVFEEATKRRAQNIARTETMKASNFGTIEGYKQSEMVKAVEWLTALDERTCDYCVAMNGKTIELGAKFFESDESYYGNSDKPMKFKGSVEFPPLHPSCRCTTVPVLKKAQEPKKIKIVKASKEEIEKRADELLKERKDAELEKLKDANKKVDDLLKEDG